MRGIKARRKIYPIPIAGLYDHPKFATASPAVRGMTISLILHYWIGECMPLPKQPARLFVAAQGDPRAWHYHKDVVLQIFHDITPELDGYYETREAGKTALGIMAAGARARKRSKQLDENAPELVDHENRAPAKSRDRYERVATPEERGPRRGFMPKR